jgi:hypothetical protein
MKIPVSSLLSLLSLLVLATNCSTTAPPVVGGPAAKATLVHTKSGRLFLNDRQIPNFAVTQKGATTIVQQDDILLHELDRLHHRTGFKELGYLREQGTEAYLPIELAARINRFCVARNITPDETETFEDRRGYGRFAVQLTH